MNEHETSSRSISSEELLERLARRDPESAAAVDEILARRGPIGQQLQQARMQAHLDVWELAERAGLERELIVGIEHGTHEASRRELELLGVALDIDFAIGKSSAA